MTLSELCGLLETVGPQAYHYEADMQEYPYIVYFEYDKKFFFSDDTRDNPIWIVQVDYFTQTEFDPVADALEKLLIDRSLLVDGPHVTCEKGGEIIHYIYDCEVPGNG